MSDRLADSTQANTRLPRGRPILALSLVLALSFYMIVESSRTLGSIHPLIAGVALVWIVGAILVLRGIRRGIYPYLLGSLLFLEWRLMTLNTGESGLSWLVEVSVAVLLWFIATLEGSIVWIKSRGSGARAKPL